MHTGKASVVGGERVVRVVFFSRFVLVGIVPVWPPISASLFTEQARIAIRITTTTTTKIERASVTRCTHTALLRRGHTYAALPWPVA